MATNISERKVSIIIPARGCSYLKKTVEDMLFKAQDEIEIIVVSDGEWPNPHLDSHKSVILIHTGTVKGMQANINAAARIASGYYLMKSDDHCMFDHGFDRKLKEDCEDNWLSVPARYSLDPEKWKRGRGPVHYLYLTFPYHVDKIYGAGFHGKKWKGLGGDDGGFWYLEEKRKDILIDDILAFQGSCWFIPKNLFFEIDCLDENYYFTQESQQLCFKVWLYGGRVVRNKKTWYAHWHKNRSRGFRLSKRRIVETEIYSMDYWMNNRWPKRKRDFKWIIDKFWPLDNWPDDWQSPHYAENFVHPNACLLRGDKHD